jgi:hypothetical protein
MLGYTETDITEMIDGLLNVHSTLEESQDKQEVWLAADFLIGLLEEGRV